MKFLRMPLPGSWKTGTGSPNHLFIQLWKDSCPTGTCPVHNCMNSWLGKPSSGFPTSWKRYIPQTVSNLFFQDRIRLI